MERKTIVIIVVAMVIGLGYFAYTRYGPQRPETSPEVAVEEEEIVPVVSASGEVVPARWAKLSFKLSGRVEELAVEVGDEVVAGQLLARLDAAELEHAVAQAEASLALARANLAQVKAGARREEIAAAEQAVAIAEANLAAAEADLARAEANLAQLLAGPSEWELELAKLTIDQAKDNLWAAQAERDGVKGNPANPDYAVDAAEAAVASAEVAVRMAEVEYERLKAGARPEEIAAARAQVEGARARVEATKAQLEQAKAQLALLKAGPTAEAVAAAEAQVVQAQAALDAAKAALSKATLTAPFAGTVGAVYVHEGEMVTPGQPIITLGDLSTLRVETTDLDEIDVARVAVGQRVTVTFDALPERVLTGHVTRISPMAEPGAGGVNYTVIVVLDEIDPAIRWGMTAFVDIVVE